MRAHVDATLIINRCDGRAGTRKISLDLENDQSRSSFSVTVHFSVVVLTSVERFFFTKASFGFLTVSERKLISFCTIGENGPVPVN